MKKIYILILVSLLFFVGMINISAVTNVFNADLSLSDNQMDTSGYMYVDINIDVSYLLKGFSAEINYDKNKLEIEEVIDEDRFDINYNENYSDKSLFISGVYNKGKTGTFTIARLKFKKTEEFVGGDISTISIKNIKGNDDTIGIDNEIISFIPGYMIVKSILADKTDITDTKKYETKSNEVNISVDVICGRVISGEGKINLNYGNNKHTIVILGDDNKEYRINIELIRETEKENKNYKDKSEKNINTGDLILKYVCMFLLSSFLLIIFLVYLKKVNLTKK